jgi:hypothetical protein
VLELLHSERFVDSSPAHVWATLLDEGTYLASERTIYRLLASHHGGVRERRDQLTHPGYAGPEVLAECCRTSRMVMTTTAKMVIKGDERAQRRGGRSPKTTTKRLTGLDMLRAASPTG